MFSKIKNIFHPKGYKGKKEVSAKGYGDYDHNLGGYTFFGDFERSGKIKKSDLINLFTGYSYVCISAISEGIAGLDRKVFWSESRNDREKNHKYNDLITNSFLEEIVGFLEITGTCYIRKKMFGKSIESLEVLRTDLVSRRSNGTYDYNINGKIYNYSDEEIFIIKSFSPFKNGLGFSPLEALGNQQAMDNEIIDWNWSFFKNGATAGTVLQTEQSVEREKKEYIANKWNSEFRGTKNGNKTAVLDNGLKVQNIASVGQKDMDFVNQRIMIRDEIFTIFRVPKVVVGITDGVGYTDRMVGKTTFSEFKLKPIAQKIEEALNKHIFKGIGFFKFINIVPIDTEQLAEDFSLGAISLNEYRIKKGYANVKDGNKNISGEVLELEQENNKKDKKGFGVEKALEKVVKDFLKKDNDEVLQKRWEKKIVRTDVYEKQFKAKINLIFDLQEKDILKKLEKKYKKKDFSFKEIDEDDILPIITYLIIYQKYFQDLYFNILKKEGKIALSEVSDSNIDIEKIKKLVGENIKKFALEIDKTTRKEIIKIIQKNLEDGNPYEVMKKDIQNKFNQFKKSRTEKIARTEVSRAVNKSRVEVWKQSGNVKYKQWWTAQDERVSKECGRLHGKQIAIGKMFYKKGDKDEDGRLITYEDIEAPPKHVNCRCDLVPILE